MRDDSARRSLIMALQHDTDRDPSWTIPAELRLRLLAALLTGPDRRATMTWDEFHEWLDEDTRAEWVDGEVIVPSPASARHQLLMTFLLRVLTGFSELHDLGVVLPPPFQMKLDRSSREPDLLFLARDHLDRLKPTYLDGPADLAVEILSPESVGRDRGDKFFEYERARIPEYWLLDPETERAEFYRLDAHGKYQVVAPDTDGRYHSAVLPGLWLNVAWLWQSPLPQVDDALMDIAD